MKEYQKTFIELAIESKALQFGSFTLKSGRLSPYFFNAANLLNSGKLDLLGECYFEAFSEENIDIHSIFGPAYKGIFLGSILSLLLSKNNKAIPLSFNRKEIKDHGEGGNIIGDNPKGKTLIIDDVLSAGTAAKESIDLIKDVGAEPVMLLIGLDRKEKGSGDISASSELELNYGIKIKSIIDLNLLIQFSKSDPNFEKYIKDLEDYRSKWGA